MIRILILVNCLFFFSFQVTRKKKNRTGIKGEADCARSPFAKSVQKTDGVNDSHRALTLPPCQIIGILLNEVQLE